MKIIAHKTYQHGRNEPDPCVGVCSSSPPRLIESADGPRLAGSGLAVWEVVLRLGEGREAGLDPAEVALCEALYEARPEPIDAAIRRADGLGR